MKQHPPLTDEERERLAVDYSDAAVADWATRLSQSHGAGAVDRAREYRTAYPASSPGASFWSRVIAQILAPKGFYFAQNSDGSGDNYTSQLSVVTTLDGNSETVAITNNGPQDGYITPAPERHAVGAYDHDRPRPKKAAADSDTNDKQRSLF